MVKETNPTGTSLKRLLPKILDEINRVHHLRPDMLLSAWGGLVGPKLAPMTRATKFEKNVLYINVNNSTLNSLLVQEKFRLLKKLQEKFPQLAIRNIIFRIGIN
jgi:predicted nucleic acid-binding Zn ribbon protein